MKNLTKLVIAVLITVMVIGSFVGCQQKPKVEPWSIDPASLIYIGQQVTGGPGIESLWAELGGDTSGLTTLSTPWTQTECVFTDYTADGGPCGNCPTCEGKTHVVMNAEPFSGAWQDMAFLMPPWPEGTKWTQIIQNPGKMPTLVEGTYNRVRIRVRCYYDDMVGMDPNSELVMASLVIDPNGDWRGPADGAGPNTPMKIFNLTSGPMFDEVDDEDLIPFGLRDGGPSSESGAFVQLTGEGTVLLFQTAQKAPAYVEILEVTFF